MSFDPNDPAVMKALQDFLRRKKQQQAKLRAKQQQAKKVGWFPTAATPQELEAKKIHNFAKEFIRDEIGDDPKIGGRVLDFVAISLYPDFVRQVYEKFPGADPHTVSMAFKDAFLRR